MTDQTFIEKLIDINQPMTTEPLRFSTIGILLRGARKLSGRDLLTGVYQMNELTPDNFEEQLYHSNLFTGLINYLIFLEQVGSIFKIKGATSTKQNGIHLALQSFSSLTEEQIFAIRALRNSLTHKYGLATEKNPDNIKLRHKFTITIERSTEIIKLPLSAWSGDFSDKSEHSNTTVYIIDLIDEIEKAFSKLKAQIDKQNIEISLAGGRDELKARFTITN